MAARKELSRHLADARAANGGACGVKIPPLTPEEKRILIHMLLENFTRRPINSMDMIEQMWLLVLG